MPSAPFHPFEPNAKSVAGGPPDMDRNDPPSVKARVFEMSYWLFFGAALFLTALALF